MVWWSSMKPGDPNFLRRRSRCCETMCGRLRKLLAFVKHMKTLLDRRLLSGESLTTRESQVLQLLFRRLTNKEIASALKMSERTAKFHVCKVLNRLGLESRRSLAETLGLETV
jgi:DNA-binding NarL/FixJ family response regulator